MTKMSFVENDDVIKAISVVDTLVLARRKHSGGLTLDDLCARYGVDGSRRTQHGALLDAERLAAVYVELTTTRQAALQLDQVTEHVRKLHDTRDRNRCRRAITLRAQQMKPVPVPPEHSAPPFSDFKQQAKHNVSKLTNGGA